MSLQGHHSVTTIKGFVVYNGLTVCVWLAHLVELMLIDRVVPGSNPATDTINSVYESSKTLLLAVTVTFFSIPFYRCSQLYYDISF